MLIMGEESTATMFSSGLITDIQYADIDTVTVVKPSTGKRTRYYRNALKLLREAIMDWNSMELKPCCMVQLGTYWMAITQGHYME